MNTNNNEPLELSEEELSKVAGGAGAYNTKTPNCGQGLKYDSTLRKCVANNNTELGTYDQGDNVPKIGRGAEGPKN